MTTTLDGFGRPISTLNAAGARTYTEYDSEGRMTFQSYPCAGGGPPGNAFAYDFLGRLTRVTHSVDGRFYWYYYAGDCAVRIDENGHQTTQYLVAFGRPENARVTTVHDGSHYWSYSYNALGNLTRVDAPQGPDRVWVYNAQNQLVSETQPESGTRTYTYRADGVLLTRTDALGTTTYAHDGDHRLTGIDAPGTADDTSFSYDTRGRRTLASMANGNETRFTYDGADRLTSREERVNGQIFTTSFAYDARDNLTAITYPSLRTVQYEYDAANRITRVFSGSQTYADLIAYHPSGARSSMRFGNNTTETLVLDDRQRPYHLVTGAAADPVDLTYGYDWASNVTSIIDPRSGKSAWYQYDGLDRLTNVTGFGANTFTYDALGNRLTKGAPAVIYTYDPGTNRLSAATSAPGPDQGAFQYDAVGNMTSDGVGGTYGYSPRNTMTSATINGATTQYTYDADGLRIQKSSATGQQYFVRGLGGQLLAEYAALFSKSAPASGHMTTNTSPTLQWTPVIGATGYAFCVDTTNNNACDTAWTGTGMATTTTVSTLAPGTYYWQAFALTSSGWKDADNGAWWSVTIYTSTFGKQGPPSGQSGLGSEVTVQWGAIPDSGYWVCWDTTNNNSCDGIWWPNGASTTKLLQGLGPTTYYWQVRADTPNGQVDADGGQWWSFTVGGGGGPSKLAPAPDLAGLSTNVLTQWTEIPGDGYWICWDTTNNNGCDTNWTPNGGSTWKVLENLAPGTYYWQVKSASSGTEFNGGAWWAFTVGAPVVSFNKQTPGNGAILTTNNAPLTWTTAAGASFYETCVGTVNNGLCDTGWLNAAQATARTLTGLERDPETAFDYAAARYYRNVWGRFTSPDDSVFMDPTSPQSFNRYTYVSNNPLRWVDPTGHQQEPINRGWQDSSSVTAKMSGPVAIDPTVSLGWVLGLLNSLHDGLLALDREVGAAATDLLAANQMSWLRLGSGDWTAGDLRVLLLASATANFSVVTATRPVVTAGMPVWRVWGNNSPHNGTSWALQNPLKNPHFARGAGLPTGNSQEWLSTGRLLDTTGVTLSRATRVGNNPGGIWQLTVPNPDAQIRVTFVHWLKPPY